MTFDRETALVELRAWLIENIPRSASTNGDFRFVNKRQRTKLLINRGKAMKQKARISMKWRSDLSNRLKICEDDVVRTINTILEMLDKELAKGGTVRISGFGDFITAESQRGGRECRFRADEDWTRSVNDPIFFNEIGFAYKKTGKKRIARRPTQA